MDMKNLILKICRWALTLLGVATAASCRVEYGTPHASFEVKGKVVDEATGKAVKGVRIIPGYGYTYTDENGETVSGFGSYGSGVVVEDGSFELNGDMYYSDYEELLIQLTDEDPEVDGHYKDSTYVVPMSKIREASRKDNWSSGTYGADITIEAELISE